MRNGVFTSSTADCSTPIGTVNRTYDASCPRISDDVLNTLGSSGNNDACQTTTACTADDIPTTCKDKDFTAYKSSGDFNCNGTVDIIDFNIWKGWYNADKEKCGALTDFNIWKDAFNKSN